jgi:hypothetical protein
MGVRVQELRDFGILRDPKCRNLGEARSLAKSVVTGRTWPFDILKLVFSLFHIPEAQHRSIRRRFISSGRPALIDFAPYAAHLVAVEVFFYAAVDAGLIGRERPSNKIDIEYLYYLPFCEVFTSADKLHRKCAPHFLRSDQRFVDADALKADLNLIDVFFKTYSEAEREKGVHHIAPAPPAHIRSLVTELWDQYGWGSRPTQPRSQPSPVISDAILGIPEAQPLRTAIPDGVDPQIGWMRVDRWVMRRKGSWCQVPKDLNDRAAKERGATN